MAVLSIPEWPAATSSEGLRFFGAAETCFAAWKAKGVSTAFALGMIAQAEAESSFDPNAMGDRETIRSGGKAPTAYGLYQLHGDRMAAVKAGIGIDLEALARAKQCTIAQCIDAAWFEFNHMHWTGMAQIAQQKSARNAAVEACILFERASADGAAERRGQMAERWSVYFAKKGFK